MPRFVIQEHYARNHHFDLRLEREGVLLSWAVPKGMPTDPENNRLAIRVEDHDLSHLIHEDPTPVGDGGAQRVKIWDRGVYEAEAFEEDRIIAFFAGKRINGKYAIFRTRGENWLIHLMREP